MHTYSQPVLSKDEDTRQEAIRVMGLVKDKRELLEVSHTQDYDSRIWFTILWVGECVCVHEQHFIACTYRLTIKLETTLANARGKAAHDLEK